MNTCDHGHYTRAEIRTIPVCEQGDIWVCFAHYQTEMNFRKERIISDGVEFDLPTWESLTVYSAAKGVQP